MPENKNVNDHQVGGDHYRKHGAEYQHWDLMIDNVGPGYLIGCATKYVARFRDSGKAVKDLEKAKHYVEKLITVYEAGTPLITFTDNQQPVRLEEFLKEQKMSSTQEEIFSVLLSYRNEDALNQVILWIEELLQLERARGDT